MEAVHGGVHTGAYVLLDADMDIGELRPRPMYAAFSALGIEWVAIGDLSEALGVTRIVAVFGALEMATHLAPEVIIEQTSAPICMAAWRRWRGHLLRGAGLDEESGHVGDRILWSDRGSTGWRRFVGEDSAMDALRAHGLDVATSSVFVGSSWSEQVRNLATARALVGVIGGGINAVIFLPPGSTMLVFYPSMWRDYSYSVLYHSIARCGAAGRRLTANPNAGPSQFASLCGMHREGRSGSLRMSRTTSPRGALSSRRYGKACHASCSLLTSWQ